MSWKVRHEGSPQSVEVATAQEVAEAFADGHWEATDEVQGPGEAGWKALESHPVFEEMAEELEAPPRVEEDESRLDMNALIDVTLVLLIFFILTAGYASLPKELQPPPSETENKKIIEVPDEVVKERMIRVDVNMVDGKPVIKVAGTPVAVDKLENALRSQVTQTKKTTVLLVAERKVPSGIVVAVLDAAAAKDLKIDGVKRVVEQAAVKE